VRRNPYRITIEFDTPEEVLAFRRLLASRNLTLEDVADALEEPAPARAARETRSKSAGAKAKPPSAKSPRAKAKSSDAKPKKQRASSAGPDSPMTRGQFGMLRGLTGKKVLDYLPDADAAAEALTYGEADALIQAAIAKSGFPEGADGKVRLPSSRYGAWVSPEAHPKEHAAIMRVVKRALGG
jgi:hypothetical protein